MYQTIVLLLLLVVVPFGCGGLFVEQEVDNYTKNSWIKRELFGWLWILAAYLPLAIVATLLEASLKLLTCSWLAIVVLSAGVGYYLMIKGKRIKLTKPVFNKDIYWILGLIVLILIQIVAVVFFQHTDEDDFTYVSLATSSWYSNTVGVYNDLGIATGWRAILPYSMSPFSVWCASVSKLAHVHPAIFMHSILPAFLIAIAYLGYLYVGSVFFENDTIKMVKFCIVYALLNIFGGFSVRSTGMFLLVRLWQGKAIATAILIPLLFAFAKKMLEEKQSKQMYILCIFTNMAIVLCSGLGIFQSGIVCGCLLVVDFVKYRSVKRCLLECLILLPNVLVFLLNHI